MKKDEISVDPTDAEFFVEDDDSLKLVREATQNSLDARLRQDEPVLIRINLVREKLFESNNGFVTGLKPHLRQVSLNDALIDEPMDYLVIEDFNTKGLRGILVNMKTPRLL